MNSLPDSELLAAFAGEHSEEAFRVLVERYSGMVYGMACRQTGDAQAAKDICQSVFIALAQEASEFEKLIKRTK